MKKNIFKILCLLMILISLSTFIYVKADSGWDTDYGSSSNYSSSYDNDYSNSYDNDYSSSWSSSNDYDSRYDTSYSSNSSHRSPKMRRLLSLIGTVGLIIAFFISILVIILIYKPFNKSRNKITVSPYRDLLESDYYMIFKKYKGEFKNIISKHFIDVQTSWMNFDYENLRKLCTDELYNQYKTQLEVARLKNEQNIMSDFEVKEISVYAIEKVNGIVEVSVYLNIKFKDYVINTKNNKVVRGNKKIYYTNGYELTFVMNDKDKITTCPSCGAKVEVTSSNVCDYCKNTVVQISDELVLSY